MKQIGKYIQQKEGFKAFIPDPFPQKGLLSFDQQILMKSEKARGRMGELDGIARYLPDIDWFLKMHINKDATASSQIEGTNAEFEDVLRVNTSSPNDLPEDVDDILKYIQGLNYGLDRLNTLPLSERIIKEMHEKLMLNSRSNVPNNTPGEFRRSQNWVNGTNPTNAEFVPPPHTELPRTLGDLEQFINTKSPEVSPLIQAALVHAQFETIHPFLDGNGRTGRMLVTLFFAEKKIMTKPLLYLSEYLKKHKETYYQRLMGYRGGKVDQWVDFFLDAIIEIAGESIQTIEKIVTLKNKDYEKIVALEKRSAENVTRILAELYQEPIVTVNFLVQKTKLTPIQVRRSLEKMVKLDILQVQNNRKNGRQRAYQYRRYIDIFV